MAGGLTSAIGEALLQLVQFVWPSAAPQIGRFAERVADVVRPDPPFSLHTSDGEVVTGIVVLDRGRASALLRHPPAEDHCVETDLRGRGANLSGARLPHCSYDADQSLWSPRPYQR